MKVVLTGAAGFLGWHTRLRLHALTDYQVHPVTRSTWSQLPAAVESADVVLHLAGVNRGTDAEVEQGNVQLAEDLINALSQASSPARVVFANSVQSGNGTPYGNGKATASSLMRAAMDTRGSHFVDVRLPNIFGEHGRPRYNSFVATFIETVISGRTPTICDRSVPLLPAQEAAARLISATFASEGELRPAGSTQSVREIWNLLKAFHNDYSRDGDFPDLSSVFRVDLFNAYRSALFPTHYPIALSPHNDPRGSFVETVRSHGGEGQSSISSTVPGATRGEHYHLRKIERFAVVGGQARISLRKMFTNKIVQFDVDGSDPVAIDMPVGWAHNITNIGTDTLLTQFWTHEHFRPDAPDTFRETVLPFQFQDGGTQ